MSDTQTQINKSDEGKPNEFAIYLYEERIGDATYGGQIVARSINGAIRRAEAFGAKIVGRAVEEMDCQNSVCSICGGNIFKDLENVEPIQDEVWVEEFE